MGKKDGARLPPKLGGKVQVALSAVGALMDRSREGIGDDWTVVAVERDIFCLLPVGRPSSAKCDERRRELGVLP